jgi:hypothetical protein
MNLPIFDELKDMSFFNDFIKKNIPFIFARYRDGEVLAMFRPDPKKSNCDNHKYFPDLGERLKESLIWFNENNDRLNLYVNLCYGKEEMKAPVYSFLNTHNINLTWTLGAKIIDNSFLDSKGNPGSMKEFFDLIKDKENTVLVGNDNIMGVAYGMEFESMVNIESVDCWLDYDNILEACLDIQKRNYNASTFLFCAGMMTEVLIRDLAELYPDSTYIDMGCIFDFICGNKNRGYMTDDYYNKVIKHYKKYTIEGIK